MPASPPGRDRTADFWTSLVLLVLAAAMIGGALQFPLRGTYAGVRNAWYVSPALLPLIVAFCLAVLALALLLTAVKAGAARTALQRSATVTGQLDVALIAGLIAAFVFGFVPRIDFIVGATFFLLAFTICFHLDHAGMARVVLAAFFATAALAGGMALSGLTPAPRSTMAFIVDGAVIVVLALTIVATVWLVRAEDRRGLRHCLGVALVTPLLLGSIFKFFLLVPLPREGLIVIALDTVRYTLRGAF